MSSAKIIQHSINKQTGTNLYTFEIEMPRIILAEVNTHKMLVRNTQSTRAVPITAAIKNMQENPFLPVYWGKKQSGMSASEENNAPVVIDGVEYTREEAFELGRNFAAKLSLAFDKAGYHKQISGRFLEPFQMIRLVVSGTEWDNFYNLRIHPAAQPEFRDLSLKMYSAMRASKGLEITMNEWHVPYVDRYRDPSTSTLVYSSNGNVLTTEEAQQVSISCIAQTSYRKHDPSITKAENILATLLGDRSAIHASPMESVATPIDYRDPDAEGITHMDKKSKSLWSAQFRDFIQYRKLIPGETCEHFKLSEMYNTFDD